MIQKYIDRFIAKKDEIKKHFSEKHPEGYKEIVQYVMSVISTSDYGEPSIDIIHGINDGDYQGTLLYLIPDNTYQPNKYFYVKVNYGSCYGCDTLQAICNYSHDKPTEQQINDYYMLALHIVENLKEI